MEDIRFYDFEFNLLHIENFFISSNWSFYYSNIGQFEAHFDLDSDTVPIIMNHEYVVVVQGDKAAIVTGKMLAEDLAVFGRTCNWILTRRTTPKFGHRMGTAVTLARNILADAFGDIPNFIVEAGGPESKEIEFWRNTAHPTFEVVKDCLDNDKIGHEVLFDIQNKQWRFRMTRGVFRPLMVSESNRNAYETEYSGDLLDYYTGGWYEQPLKDEGEWDAYNNLPRLYNFEPINYKSAYKVSQAGYWSGINFAKGDYLVFKNPDGKGEKSDNIDPFPVYIGASDTEGIYRWDCPLSGENESEWQSSLAGQRKNQSIKAKSIDLIWKKSYDLGDTIKIEVRKGGFVIAETKRIVGVNIWTEYNDYGEQPIFEKKGEE